MGKHKINTKFISRIFGIAIVIMLITSTNLWAKPKNSVEYTPFKSENPNASVYECECVPGYYYGFEVSYDIRDYNSYKLFEWTSIVVHGWEKKKGGWEKLMEYKPKDGRDFFGRVRGSGNSKYTHYAVEFEAPEYSNSLIISANEKIRGHAFDGPYMEITLSISEEYKKLIGEKRAAEEVERQRLAAEEKAKKEAQRNAEIDAKAKEIAKGYVYHGTAEARRNQKLFSGGALEEGHAYYIPGFVVKYSGNMASIEQADGFLFSSQSSPVSVSYINQKVKGEVVESSSTIFLGKTIEISLSVVIVGGKAPLHTPVVIGLIE